MPQSTKTGFLFIASLALLSACSPFSKNKKENMVFHSRISDSGLKHFEIRARGRANRDEFDSPSSERNRRQNDRPPANPARQHERNQKKMTKIAEEFILENAYCREGFWVLDFDTDTRGPFLRGECNEQASEADRIQFPDTIKNW